MMSATKKIYQEAIKRGLLARESNLKEAGGVYSLDAVSKLLGVSKDAVQQQVSERQLIAVLEKDETLFPVCQFSNDAPLPGLKDVLQELNTDNPWTQLSWLLSGDPRLDGTPLEYLLNGRVQATIAAARMYGVHGAA
tara:strand:- start:23828 stop:24238 length:411 start_codon:yes stop_codon:yes gene_type:complete